MAQVTFRLLKPTDLVGEIIAWRTNEPWSHAVVIFGDAVYSSIFPKVLKTNITDTVVSFPPRKGDDFILEVTDDQYNEMLNWCKRQVGKNYDYLSMLGWALGLKQLQTPHRTYCFEFCWDTLLAAGLDIRNGNLITGTKLIEQLTLLDPISTKIYNLKHKIS